MKKLLSLSEFISWLNSLTTMELINEFPRSFHTLKSHESKDEAVLKLVSNDAILWRFVKDYNKFLLTDLDINLFEGDNKLFLGGKYHNIQPSTVFNYYEIGGIVIFRDTNANVNGLKCKRKIEDISGFNIELAKPINQIIK